jgi:hypothetical protein
MDNNENLDKAAARMVTMIVILGIALIVLLALASVAAPLDQLPVR